MQPDEPTTDEERQEKLPQDNQQTPFQPPDDGGQPGAAPLDDTHPATDTSVDPQQQYDEGVASAAEAQEPNAGNSVTSYDPSDEAADKADTPS